MLTAGGTITNTTFTKTAATPGQGAVKVAGVNQAALQTALDKLANCSILFNTIASGGLHLILTGAGGSLINLTTSSLSFYGNNYDIYWEAPSNTPLTLQQTGTQANIAKTSQATNSNTVILPPVRTLILAGLEVGSNVSVYNANTFASPTVPIAGVATIPGIAVGTGGLQYPYLYYLSITNVLSGTIAVGQTVTGDGILPGTTIIAQVNTYVWTLSQNGVLQPGTVTYTFTTFAGLLQSNLVISNDMINTGKYQAVYSYVYTTALGTVSGYTLNITSLLSGNITIGQTVNGISPGISTVITGLGTGTGGVGTYYVQNYWTQSSTLYLTFDTPVNVVVLNNGYQALRPSTSLTYNGTTVTVAQQLDRQFSNPG